MGLENNSGSRTYVNIKEGKLFVGKGDERKEFTALTGYITDLEIKQDEYQGEKYDVLLITVVDEGDKFLLKMRVGSGYFIGFCMAIGNADLRYKISIIPNLKEEDGKKKMTCFLTQKIGDEKGKALKWTWSKDNPGDLPPLNKVRFQGKDKWDGYEQTEFLKGYLMHVIKAKLDDAHPIMQGGNNDSATRPAGAGAAPKNADPAAGITEPIDDLPF